MKSKRPSESPYLTPIEAAEILRVDRKTIYARLQDGSLKAVKLGKVWRIPRNAVMPNGDR